MAEVSDDFYPEAEVPLDADVVKDIRDVISAWANSIPHHNLKNFGDNIKITSLHYRPTYIHAPNTLYEYRSVRKSTRPYKGESIPRKTINSPDEVDPWEYNYEVVSDFEDHESSYIVDGSQEVSTCSKCSGAGRITCPQCGGAGQHTCSTCKGSGQTTCIHCHGTGSHSCVYCHGRGTIKSYGNKTEIRYNPDGSSYRVNTRTERTSTCPKCSGSGKIECAHCHGRGKVRCRTCRGEGTSICQRCSGRGKITCPQCEGHAKMMSYIAVDQRFDAIFQPKYTVSYDVDDRYPNFFIDPYNTPGDIIINEDFDRIPLDYLEGTTIDQLFRENVQNTFDNPPHGTVGKSTKIHKQNLQVSRVNVYDLEYTYKGKAYRMLVYGSMVYAPQSPLTELAELNYKKAKGLYRTFSYGKALNFAERAESLDTANELPDIDELKTRILNAFPLHYKVGVFLSGIAAAIFYGFFATPHWLQTPRFIAPQAQNFYQGNAWIASNHATILGILYVLYLLYSHFKIYKRIKKRFGKRVRSDAVRVLFAFIISAVTASLAWIGLMIADAAGITLIISYAVFMVAQLFPGVSATLQETVGQLQ